MMLKSGDNVLICGTLPRDAEFRYVGDKGAELCKFGVLIGHKGTSQNREAIWCNCICWRNVAKAAAAFKKGEAVICAGKLEQSVYQNKDGEEVTKVELNCEFVMKGNDTSGFGETEPDFAPEFCELQDEDDDGDLPF